jgi:deazaflavin-dependent oxidoreductase (nitroreductase family)
MAQAEWAKKHVERYRSSNGAEGHIWTGFDGKGDFPCLLLTTTGRRTRRARTTPLIYGKDGDSYIIIASQGGRLDNPAWYKNLLAEETVKLQVGSDVFAATARTAGPTERSRMWLKMIKIYPPYDEYQEKASASREIPLVILTRS